MNKSLKEVVKKCWKHYNNYKSKNKVITPSIPILYFGNFKKYNNSETKILTVGLNPSKNEFPKECKFIRFPGAEKLSKKKKLNDSDIELYLKILNRYFKNCPYNWFKRYEIILNSLNCSYYENNNYPNRAIHTDICTPLATNPTWSKMRKSKTNKNLIKNIKEEGIEIWHELIKVLKPDLILASVSKEYLKKIKYKKREWKQFHEIKYKKDGKKRKQTYVVEKIKLKISDTKEVMLIYGKAAQYPFGLISDNEKKKLGKKILKKLMSAL